MNEIQTIKGKHKCGIHMDIRVVEIPENEKDIISKTFAWMIYSLCKKCRVVLIQGMFIQSNRPTLNIDFIIIPEVVNDYDLRK